MPRWVFRYRVLDGSELSIFRMGCFLRDAFLQPIGLVRAAYFANPVDGKSKKKIASSIHSTLEPPLFAMKELFQQTHRICTVILYLLAMQLISILPYRFCIFALSFCQSGRWGRYRSFTSIQTNVEHVNAACTSFGDPNPPNYNALQYQLTCGSRYCSTVLGYGFGMINENGPGYKLDSPYNSDPSAFVSIACAR